MTVTFKGNPMTLRGPELHVGDPAPEFTLTAGDLSNVTLDECSTAGTAPRCSSSFRRSIRGVCSLESEEVQRPARRSCPTGVTAAVVSMDLPFAQARWCGAEGDVKLQMLSDYRDHSFGLNYGLLIAELGLAGARDRRDRQGQNDSLRADRAGGRAANPITTPHCKAAAAAA